MHIESNGELLTFAEGLRRRYAAFDDLAVLAEHYHATRYLSPLVGRSAKGYVVEILDAIRNRMEELGPKISDQNAVEPTGEPIQENLAL